MNDDWPERMLSAIERRRSMRFSWGHNDCLSFALAVLNFTTRRDHLKGTAWREKRDVKKAAELLRTMTLPDLMTSLLDEPVAPAMAQRGDVVAVDIDGRQSLAICIGTDAVGPGEHAMVSVPMSTATIAWRKFGEPPCHS